MTVVIRPSPDVFRRTTPLLVVFGVYLGASGRVPEEGAALAALLSEVRRFRVPVAFCRAGGSGEPGEVGHWLAGCRPTIRDMVFDLGDRPCFEDGEFSRALASRGVADICLCGPKDDSLLQRSIECGLADNRRFVVVDLDEPLRQRSAPGPDGTCISDIASMPPVGYRLSTESWLAKLRNTSTIERPYSDDGPA